jgi:hypothetical protein
MLAPHLPDFRLVPRLTEGAIMALAQHQSIKSVDAFSRAGHCFLGS